MSRALDQSIYWFKVLELGETCAKYKIISKVPARHETLNEGLCRVYARRFLAKPYARHLPREFHSLSLAHSLANVRTFLAVASVYIYICIYMRACVSDTCIIPGSSPRAIAHTREGERKTRPSVASWTVLFFEANARL